MNEWKLKSEVEKLQSDNIRLSNRCALLDHAIRSIAEAAGMTEAFTGVDFDPGCGPLVDMVRDLKEIQDGLTIAYMSGFHDGKRDAKSHDPKK